MAKSKTMRIKNVKVTVSGSACRGSLRFQFRPGGLRYKFSLGKSAFSKKCGIVDDNLLFAPGDHAKPGDDARAVKVARAAVAKLTRR